MKTTPIHSHLRLLLCSLAATFLLLVPAQAQNVDHHETHGTEDSDDGANKAEVKTHPADGDELTAPVRALRVWFPHAPDVVKSSLKLVGPKGEMTVQGLHTMGEDDLMARVVGPMPNGEYTATWSTMHDGEDVEGSWKFTIKRKSNL